MSIVTGPGQEPSSPDALATDAIPANAVTTDALPAEVLTTGAEPSAPRRLRRVLTLAAIAIVSLAVGIGATFLIAPPLLADKPRYDYTVRVYLQPEATDAQKQAIRTALADRYPADSISFTDAEQAFEHYQKKNGGILPPMPDELSELFKVRITNITFHCSKITPVMRMPGVDHVTINRKGLGSDAAEGAVHC